MGTHQGCDADDVHLSSPSDAIAEPPGDSTNPATGGSNGTYNGHHRLIGMAPFDLSRLFERSSRPVTAALIRLLDIQMRGHIGRG